MRLALLLALLLTRPGVRPLAEVVRLPPDLLRLLKRLADKSLPRSVRIRLALLMVYLASPIDLIPDFLPVIGHADDAIMVAVRGVVRWAGIDAAQPAHRPRPAAPPPAAEPLLPEPGAPPATKPWPQAPGRSRTPTHTRQSATSQVSGPPAQRNHTFKGLSLRQNGVSR